MPDKPIPPRTPPILIKRYPQSRLYDTVAARYRTVGELRHWAETGVRFTVVDIETGHDVTQSLLA